MIRGNGFKLKMGRYRLDIRNKLFTMSVVRHRTRLCREALDAPSLEVFKVSLGQAFEQPDLIKNVPAHGGGLD